MPASNRKPEATRRDFLRKGLSVGLAGAALGSHPQKASGAVNPGYEKQDPAYVGQAGKRWAMLIDLRKCVGCQACTVACKIENAAPDGHFRTWVPDVELGKYPDTRRAFLPRLCNHCERPSCIEVCPAGATWQRRDGVVVIDYDLCWGCGSCVDACPYDARFMNPVTRTADKCNFCAHRIDEGLEPACVETCIGGARQFGDLKDPESPVARALKEEVVSVLKPGTGNEPRVFYIDLPHELQNNLPGTPALWSQGREAVGKPEEEWRLEAVEEPAEKEAENV